MIELDGINQLRKEVGQEKLLDNKEQLQVTRWATKFTKCGGRLLGNFTLYEFHKLLEVDITVDSMHLRHTDRLHLPKSPILTGALPLWVSYFWQLLVFPNCHKCNHTLVHVAHNLVTTCFTNKLTFVS